jgi:hypothetical protein
VGTEVDAVVACGAWVALEAEGAVASGAVVVVGSGVGGAPVPHAASKTVAKITNP